MDAEKRSEMRRVLMLDIFGDIEDALNKMNDAYNELDKAKKVLDEAQAVVYNIFSLLQANKTDDDIDDTIENNSHFYHTQSLHKQ